MITEREKSTLIIGYISGYDRAEHEYKQFNVKEAAIEWLREVLQQNKDLNSFFEKASKEGNL